MEKKTFRIELVELLSRVIEVEATSKEEAEDIIMERYDNCDIVLDYNDLGETYCNLLDENNNIIERL